MELYYSNLSDFLSKNIFLEKGDYLYHHNKIDYPKKEEIDLANLYFVLDANNKLLKLYPMSGNTTIDIDLSIERGNWWILKLPVDVRKSIGLDR